MMMASKPACFSTSLQSPPEWESKITPRVSLPALGRPRGDFDMMQNLPELGTLVPVNGPVANMRAFSGPSGSVSGPTRS